MVVPSFPTLFANASWQTLGYLSPVKGSIFVNNLSQDSILFLCPAALCKVGAISDLKPPRVTLDLRLASDLLADSVP